MTSPVGSALRRLNDPPEESSGSDEHPRWENERSDAF